MALLFGCGGRALQEIMARNDAASHLPPALSFGLHVRIPGNAIVAATQVLAIYEGVFHGTIYYTPREDAFTTEAGFDVAPSTRPGLKKKRFPRDFLKAVELEGFGLMRVPVEGKRYISCCRGCWNYAEEAVDSAGQVLQPLSSTAIGAEYDLVRSRISFQVRATGIPSKFAEARWKVCDTGSGLKPGQIDFYWGEDAPLGPAQKLSRPKGMPDPIANLTVVVLR
jgi:hypothetical protein